MDGPIVIVGAGMAAWSVAKELRKRGSAAPLLLVSQDAAASYAKPMLSNALALGRSAGQIVSATADQLAAQLSMQVLARTRVTAIDTAARTIMTDTGRVIGYGQLVLALGAQPVRPALDGDAAAEVLSVNHIDDYADLRARLERIGGSARVMIIGAGLVGCEFADDLAGSGHRVTLVDPNARPLSRLAAPSLSQGLAAAWTGRVALRLGTTAVSVDHADGALRVSLADGGSVHADLVIAAVGLRPSVALAQAAGLTTQRGIVVDAHGRTSAANVYALGDCADYHGVGVLPYVAPLLAAARAIAATLAGTPTPMELTPDPVIVKTPSCKLALLPPPPGIAGAWVEQVDGARTIARFIDGSGAVRGFGLSAHTPALRAGLLDEMRTAHA